MKAGHGGNLEFFNLRPPAPPRHKRPEREDFFYRRRWRTRIRRFFMRWFGLSSALRRNAALDRIDSSLQLVAAELCATREAAKAAEGMLPFSWCVVEQRRALLPERPEWVPLKWVRLEELEGHAAAFSSVAGQAFRVRLAPPHADPTA